MPQNASVLWSTSNVTSCYVTSVLWSTTKAHATSCEKHSFSCTVLAHELKDRLAGLASAQENLLDTIADDSTSGMA